MKQANSNYTTSRRRLLGRSTAALAIGAATVLTGGAAVPGASVSAGDDDELLGLCAEFHRLHALAIAPGDEAVWGAALDDRWSVSDEIQDTPARTLAGHRAKAAVAVVLQTEAKGRKPTDACDVFAVAMLRDLAGADAPGTAPKLKPNPDAGLIAMADEVLTLDLESARLWDTADEIADHREADRFRQMRAHPLIDRSQDLQAQLAITPAMTLEGFRAKARIIQRINNCAPGYASPYQDDAMAWSLANDLLGAVSLWQADEDEGVAA